MIPSAVALNLAVLLVAATGCGGSDGPPLAPTGLSAAEVGATTVALTWVDHSLTETGFRIDRSRSGGGFEVAGTVGSDVTGFADSGLAPATAYRYRVHALFANGDTVASAELAVVTGTPEIRGTSPATGFAVGDQQITVHGDGFSAGVDRVSFAGFPGHELRVFDDATLMVNLPRGLDLGPAEVTLATPASTTRLVDRFEVYRWPPVYTPVSELRAGMSAAPEGVQMVATGRASHLFWIDAGPRRMLYTARSDAGRWEAPILLSSPRSEPRHPHAAVDGRNAYVVWLASGEILLARSNDGGVTYRGPVQVPAPEGTTAFFPQVAATGEHVHVVWSDQRAGRGEVYHTVSHDGGRTFGRAGFRINEFAGAFDVRVAASGSHVYVIWWTAQGFGGVKFQRSTDHGDTWTEPDQHLGFVTGSVRASAPQIFVDHDRVFVLSHSSGNRRIGIQRSTDHGVSWDPLHTLDENDDPSISARVAFSPGGEEVCVVWHQTPSTFGSAAVELNRSLDGGASWLGYPEQVAAVPGAMDSTPVVRVDGSVVTVAYAHDDGGRSDVFVVHAAGWTNQWQGRAWLNHRDARLPSLHGHGGDITVGWVGCDPGRESWSLRTVRSMPR